ncbi:MAG: hypothetical protein QOH67_4830 [Hyphomicrobiales bacterium]|nr:hypothetical protein [Hyphomicrobiales bacterium]
MSTELAVTAVTQTLRQLLEEGIPHKWGIDVLSGDLTKERYIETLPPCKVRERRQTENVVNLFLYRTDVNAAWRNLSMPVQGKPGERDAPPLALNLEYLISAYGEDDREEVAHFFLGQAMRILHDVGMVPRQKFFDVLKKARVQNQIERITVTPRQLSIDDISKLWTVFQTQYRVSAAYLVTVVLIDSQAPTPSALPVLKRGPDDRGVDAVAAAPPVLDSAVPASGFNAAVLGDDIVIAGERLDLGGATAMLRHPLMPQPQSLATTMVNGNQLRVTLPAANSAPGIAAAWPAGIYSLWLSVTRPGKSSWATNEVPFLLAPSIKVAPSTVQPPAAWFEVTLTVLPQVHPSQTGIVIFDDAQIAPRDLAAPANADAPSTITADVPGNAVGVHRIRLRVDGIDSLPMKKTGDVIDFDPDQSVEVKP